MTEKTEPGGWQQIFTVEDERNLEWVLQEVRSMLPPTTTLEGVRDESGYIDVFCTPPLVGEELQAFEQQFDGFDFTDVAFSSSSGIHRELPVS